MAEPVRIATVCQNGEFFPTAAENREHVLARLEPALKTRPDLVVLPEHGAKAPAPFSPNRCPAW